jgi:hypothetical protein
MHSLPEDTMARSKVFFIPFAIELLLLACISTHSQSAENARVDRSAALGKTTGNDLYRPFLINNIMTWYSNTGDGSLNPYTLRSGFEYPKGSGNTSIFEDGVVWGGFHKGRPLPKVGGSTYWRGIQAGVILAPGGASENEVAVGDNPYLDKYRAFTVRPDITPTTPFSAVQTVLEAEATLINRFTYVTAQQLFNIYLQDWNEWPARSASNPTGVAPFKDVNGDGLYEPNIDIPGQPGADETMYYAANDADLSRSTTFAGSPVIGLEMHRTIWAYNVAGAVGNTIFERTILINKSGAPVDSMFIVQWADPDLGDANDDFAGCDPSLDLGYVYNSKPSDAIYGTTVPAVGYTLLQGPVVPGQPADSALFQGSVRRGYRNLRLTTFTFFVGGSSTYSDPAHGMGGDLQWYRLMNGLVSGTGAPFINPLTSQPTKFTLDGDPVAGTGWIDGTNGLVPGDRRICLVSGPFTLANNDTQEIVVATTAATGTDYLNSITALKAASASLKTLQAGGIFVSIAPVDTLYPAHVPITLIGSGASFAQIVPVLDWSIASKPAASSASILPIGPTQAQITPDTPGVYRIRLVGSGGSASPDTAYVDLRVTTIQRPIASFTLAPSVDLDDTISIDGSASSDPNGLTLSHSWKVTGSRGVDIFTPRDSLSGYLSSRSDPVVKFAPYRTNLHSVQLDVSNGTFVTSLIRAFEVKPLASPGVSVQNQLVSGELRRLHPGLPGFGTAGYYGWGPVKEFGGQIWVNDGGVCAALNFSDIENPTHMYGMWMPAFDVNQSYVASFDSYSAFFGHIDSQGSMNSLGYFYPFNHITPDTSIRGVIVRQQYLLLLCGKPGVLVVDMSNSSSPLLVGQFSNNELWQNSYVDGDLLYATHPATNKVSVVNIASLPTITSVAAIGLDQGYSSITKVGPYFYLIKANTSPDSRTSNADAIAVYDFSNPGSPVKKGSIAVPKTFNEYNRFNAISGHGDTVVASTAEGVYIFDVGDPTAPTVVGKFLTGSFFSTVFINATHLLAVNMNRNGGDDWQPGPAYEGLLEFKSPFTAVEDQSVLTTPTAFALEQNYPNPFNPLTIIKYTIGGVRGQGSGVSKTKLVVYDLLGRDVATLVDEAKRPGGHEVSFDGSGLASGVYFYRLTAGDFTKTRKLLLLK